MRRGPDEIPDNRIMKVTALHERIAELHVRLPDNAGTKMDDRKKIYAKDHEKGNIVSNIGNKI